MLNCLFFEFLQRSVHLDVMQSTVIVQNLTPVVAIRVGKDPHVHNVVATRVVNMADAISSGNVNAKKVGVDFSATKI